MWALEPVYYPTFWVFIVFIVGGHEKVSDGIVAFEVHLDAQVIAGLIELFPQSFCIVQFLLVSMVPCGVPSLPLQHSPNPHIFPIHPYFPKLPIFGFIAHILVGGNRHLW